MIANVTYGYTSANFSGRMPCIEVGDSVVSKGRETLERAIKLVEGFDDHGRPRWPGAKVVYGELIFFVFYNYQSHKKVQSQNVSDTYRPISCFSHVLMIS